MRIFLSFTNSLLFNVLFKTGLIWQILDPSVSFNLKKISKKKLRVIEVILFKPDCVLLIY